MGIKVLVIDEVVLGKLKLLQMKDRNALSYVEMPDDFVVNSSINSITSEAIAAAVDGVYLDAVQQALSGAGAINVTSYYTAWTSTGANAGTLADGTYVGQLKKIHLIVDGGDATLTPSNLEDGTTIVFADAGDFAILKWNGTGWRALELGNTVDGVTKPVLS